MTRSQARFDLAVRRTQSTVFTASTFCLPGSNEGIPCSIGEIEQTAGALRSGGGGQTTVRSRTMTVRRSVLSTEPPAGRNITLNLPVPEVWEVGSFMADAVLWNIVLKAPNQE